ncbi:hypothetical protein AB0K09_03500 [Streptomyces sp. NPDC049577]|uniref:hypothetical protein n=1 Tax=Streptomyces sp. NPDC049577 TaxID=3155153 RepID=UPI0034471844
MNDGMDHPLRDALVLLVLGLAGPAAVLHQPIGRLLDVESGGPQDARPPAASAPDAPARH